jgi:hypothetical protein
MHLDVIKLLDKDVAAYYASKVKSNKDLWIDRGGFYTLGTSTYLDDPEVYPAIAQAINLNTKMVLNGLWHHITEALPKHWVPNKAVHLPDTGYMGAHIFTPESNGTQGHPHIDEPFTRIKWGQHFSNPFSFTLALEMPKVGGGLDFWPNATDEEIEAFIQDDALPEHDHVRYAEGFLYVHDGLTPHRIANCGDMEEGEPRITLQGHGVTLEDGTTAIYF